MDDRTKGWYRKFNVSRTDGRDGPGQKHAECDYFVLDLHHDPHSVSALRAYADSCEKDGYMRLAKDIRQRASLMEHRFQLLAKQEKP